MNIKDAYMVVGLAFGFLLGTWYGYTFPRDVELESTKPVAITYEVSADAARLLILKGVKGCPTDPNAS